MTAKDHAIQEVGGLQEAVPEPTLEQRIPSVSDGYNTLLGIALSNQLLTAPFDIIGEISQTLPEAIEP